jgi:hypothetical protein
MSAALTWVGVVASAIVAVMGTVVIMRDAHRRIDRDREARIAAINEKFMASAKQTMYAFRADLGPAQTADLAVKFIALSKARGGEPAPGYYALMESFMEGCDRG